jgi:preprotein translocase subunit SecA
MPIESAMVSGTVENAQKKLEARNFGIRKNVLQYDDVMSRQREIIYGQRNQVLNGEDLREQIRKMVHDSIEHTVNTHMPANSLRESWVPSAVREKYKGLLTTDEDLVYTPDELEDVDPAEVTEMLNQRAMDILDAREAEVGSDIMRELERVILLKNVDRLWIDHIDAMEELKRGIGLRAYAQRDPVVEYRMEGFDMFDAMINEIRGETARLILTVRLHRENDEPKREQVAKPAPTAGDGTDTRQPVRKKKVGRNDPCPCGSGLKYKKCCGRDA